MKKILFILPIVALLAAGCKSSQQTSINANGQTRTTSTSNANQNQTNFNNNSVSQNQSTSSNTKNKTSDITLPEGYVGTWYSGALLIQGVTKENLGTVVDSKKLPPGLFLQLDAIPCAPQSTSQCLPQPYLHGKPTSPGNYQFVITTPSETINYSLQISAQMNPSKNENSTNPPSPKPPNPSY